MDLKARIAWLGRMPLKFKLLFGSQALFFTMALKFRLADIERAKSLHALQEKADKNGGERNESASE